MAGKKLQPLETLWRSHGIPLAIFVDDGVGAGQSVFSKVIDFDDYSVHDYVFKQLEQLWGPDSIDRFASSCNAKLSRFNFRFLQLGTEAVDAFTQDWSSENNWLVPRISLIGKLLPQGMNPKQSVLSLCPCGNLLISGHYYAAMAFILTPL